MRNFVPVVLLWSSSLFAADFFPLENGNTWTYRESKSGETFTVTVGTPVAVSQQVYYSLNGYVERRVLARIDQRGDLVYLDEEREQEFPLTSFTPFQGGYWNAPFRLCDPLGQTQEKRESYQGPAGRFAAVLDIRYRTFACADAGLDSEKFLENVGMLRRVTASIAGPRTFDLVYARIGQATIDGLTSGRFNVSVEQVPGAPSVMVTMRLHSDVQQPLKVTYPSSQEYEVVLRDRDGRVLWTWSDGQVFTQALREVQLRGEWTRSVVMPVPSSVQLNSELCVCTMQAWMTTAGPVPNFSATVPFTFSNADDLTKRIIPPVAGQR